VGEPFLAEAIAGWASIPEPLWRRVEQAGWRVRLAEYVVDAAPSLRNVRPRGWKAPYTWSHTDAVNLPGSRLLVLAEKRLRPGGEVVFSDRVAGVFRHEIGHAFDSISGHRYRYNSATPTFVSAYAHDVKCLSGEDRETLRYYLQRQPAGRQETFAEAFAVQLGGGSDVTKRSDFERAFPSVLDFVRQQIDGFAPSLSTPGANE